MGTSAHTLPPQRAPACLSLDIYQSLGSALYHRPFMFCDRHPNTILNNKKKHVVCSFLVFNWEPVDISKRVRACVVVGCLPPPVGRGFQRGGNMGEINTRRVLDLILRPASKHSIPDPRYRWRRRRRRSRWRRSPILRPPSSRRRTPSSSPALARWRTSPRERPGAS